MKKCIFLLLMFSIFTFCKTDNAEFQIISFELEEKYQYCSEDKIFSSSTHTYFQNDTAFIIFNDVTASEIVKYNLLENKVSKIISLRQFLNPNEFFSFYYHNKDSIIILREVTAFGPEIAHENLLFMINSEGDIHTVFNFKDSPFPNSENHELSENSVLLSHDLDKLVVHGNRLFLSAISPFSKNNSLREDEEEGIFLLSYIDFTKNRNLVTFKSLNPIPIDTMFPKSRRYEITPLSKNILLIGEMYSPVIWKLNIDNNSVEMVSSNESQQLISNNDSAFSKSMHNGSHFHLINYSKIYPINKDGKFLRTAQINAPLDYSLNEALDFSFKNSWLGLYDENLTLIAEAIVSKDIYTRGGEVIDDELYFTTSNEDGTCSYLQSFNYQVEKLKLMELEDYYADDITPRSYSKPMEEILIE